MTMQEMATAIQYELPIKVFILNNEWMGMVRQWQQLLHGERYSHSYSASLPDFVKMAEAFGAVGLRADQAGRARRRHRGDDRYAKAGDRRLPCGAQRRTAFPMIPSGKAHNEMLLAEDAGRSRREVIGAAGRKGLV